MSHASQKLRPPIEERKPLLPDNEESRFLQLCRSMITCLTSWKTKLAAVVCISLFITLAWTWQLHAIYGRLDSKLTETEELYDFSKFGEKRALLEEWSRAKKLLLLKKEKQKSFVLKENFAINIFSFGNNLQGKKQVEIEELVDCALILEHLKSTFKKCISIDALPEECKELLIKQPNCNEDYPYRTMDGSCNNLVNPRWGMSGASFRRWLKADYEDDVSVPRTSVYGVPLVNARALGNKIYTQRMLPDSEASMLFMNFGLFLDHDMIQSSQPQKTYKGCCSKECQDDPNLKFAGCMEIQIPVNDPFFATRNVSCMEFYRDSPAVGTCPGRREQRNLMTSYIDGSQLYAATLELTKNLRSFQNGALRISGNNSLLPIKENSGTTCYTREVPYKCFLSGDVRSNMHLELMTMHTLWHREHNRLAAKLQLLNPHGSDERLFQEARRILIAELQFITYAEYLPILFGDEQIKKYELYIDKHNIYDDYDETVDAGIHNAFSSAAFRFGHSLIQDKIELRNSAYKLRSKIPFHYSYVNPTILHKNGLDDIVRGMVAQCSRQVDSFVTSEVRDRLLQRYYQDHGYDLTATSIQRGRDHGIPPYTAWRTFCGMPEIKSWEDMDKVMDKKRVNDLREMYMSVHDVELIPGGLSEYHEEGSFLGPTYLCLLGKQFRSLRKGDRF